jgi:dipeptidyl-peptidase-4
MQKKSILFSLLFWGTFFSANAQKISFDDIFNNRELRAKPAKMGEFSVDGKYLIATKSTTNAWWIITQNPANPNDSINTLFHSTWINKKIQQGTTTFSNDQKFLLVETNQKQIYRHSASVNAYVVDIASKKVIEIPGRLRYPTLSPDNKNVAYVKDNNMFIFNLESQTEKQITSDGKINSIINGAVDWVYEEEFSMSVGFQWSPTGKYLAYYRFDESNVKEFSMDIFNDLYPSQEKWKYPKAGEANSVVDVYVHDLTKNKNVQAFVESQRDQYIPRIKWSQTDNALSIQRLNRLQNHWELLFCDPNTGNCKLVLEEKDAAYVEITDDLMFIPNSTQFLYTSEKSGFNHLYIHDYTNNKSTQITEGNWQVNKICGYNGVTKTVYYTSTEYSTIQDNLWKVSLDKKKRAMFKTNDEGNCSVIMSENANWYYIIQNSFSEKPVYKTILVNGNLENKQNSLISRLNSKIELYSSSQITTIEENQKWTENMGKMNLGNCSFGQIKNSEGVALNYWMIKPYNFDSTKKYPVLMYMYGGPGHSTVRNAYAGRNFLWFQHLASLGYVIFSVDNRGTGNMGAAFKKSTYLNLGKLEQEDQAAGAQWLKSQKFIDGSRIGLWGWSFGGYLTSLCLVKSPDLFKMGMAVAPVTHWKFYDNIYTERYLRTPELNKMGYEDNSPLNFTSSLKAKYLIVHGTADDNVHFQNATEMIKAMIKSGTNFDSEVYPNRNHGIGDTDAQKHLFRKLTTFVKENL